MRVDGDSLDISLFGMWPLRFSVTVDSLVLMSCEVVAVAMVDLTLRISSVMFMIVEGF